MRAFYHHKDRWVEGVLVCHEATHVEDPEVPMVPPRITFKVKRGEVLRQDKSIRTAGRIEEPVRKALKAPPSMVRSYRPPQGTTLLFLKIGRPPYDRQAAFAVEDPDTVLGTFPQPGD